MIKKFIIIRQEALFKLLNDYNKNKPKNEQIWLDANDMVIFDYIAQFYLSNDENIKKNRIIVDGVEYVYLTYNKILEDNPILYIKSSSKDKLAKRIKKLEKLELIKKLFHKKNGNKTYYTLSPKGYTLIAKEQEALPPKGKIIEILIIEIK